jgi:hypothetical protein
MDALGNVPFFSPETPRDESAAVLRTGLRCRTFRALLWLGHVTIFISVGLILRARQESVWWCMWLPALGGGAPFLARELLRRARTRRVFRAGAPAVATVTFCYYIFAQHNYDVTIATPDGVRRAWVAGVGRLPRGAKLSALVDGNWAAVVVPTRGLTVGRLR